MIDIERTTVPYVADVNELKKPDYLYTGDVVISDTAEDETVGKAIEIINPSRLAIVSGLHTIPCRPKRKFVPSYLGYYINSIPFHTQLFPYMQGIKVTSISKGNIGKTKISFPTLDEQFKITKLLNLLSSKIDKQRQLIKALKLYKRGALSKLFPQHGETTPRYRFAGFTDPWEQRKLGEICTEMLAGGDVEKEKLVLQGKYPVLANALTNDGVVGFYENDYRVKAPAVTITGRGDVGHAKARKVNFTPVVRLLAIRTAHDVDFIENAINTLKIVVESTGVPQLTVPQLERYELYLPSTVEEEKAIGSYFVHLDHLITLHQHKLNEFENIKSGLLQQIFI